MIDTGRLHVRLLVHALDRTGPPMLALALGDWLRRNQVDWTLDIVAFRGGPLLNAALDIGPVCVLVDPAEPWDHEAPDPDRVEVARSRSSVLGPAEVMLAVSVAAVQCVPLLAAPLPPLVTWSIERGEDLHWIDSALDPVRRTEMWLAGSSAIRAELSELLPQGTEIAIAPEFVAPHPPTPSELIDRCRRTVGATSEGLLVVGAGIATPRKAPDLFLEVALEHQRRGRRDRFVWIGGEHDPMFHPLIEEGQRLLPHTLRFLGNVEDVTQWFAAADVVLHTARLDAFPLVCLHAALAGTPVVGFSEVSAQEEMFGEAALTAPYPDLGSLGSLIERLDDPTFRARQAEAQRRHVHDRWVVDRAAPRIAEQLARFSGASPRGTP